MLRKVTDTILYVGANDHEVDLFEGQYVVPNGMAYNSYVILDEKVAVMDTIDARKPPDFYALPSGETEGRLPRLLFSLPSGMDFRYSVSPRWAMPTPAI